jgi:cytochrome P450
MGFGWMLTLLPYGDHWRRSRKLLHTHMHPGIMPKYHSVQLAAARRFARDILDAKQDDDVLHRMIHTSIGQTIIKVVYGIDLNETDSEYVSLTEKLVDNFNEATLPGRFLVDFLPVCKYLVWCPWRS